MSVCAVLCALLAAPVFAQSFEVVSVKPNRSGNPRSMRVLIQPGKFAATAMPLFVLIRTAYNVPVNPSQRMPNVPEWTARDLYDIEAKAPAGAFPPGLTANEVKARMLPMLRRLLADYFHLEVRAERKEMAVYALTVGPGGPKLQKAAVVEKDCPMGVVGQSTCHQFQGGIGRGLHATAADMKDLAAYIENWSDLPVIDRTGVRGLYAIDTEPWAPMTLPPPPPDHVPSTRPSGDGDILDPGRPTLFVVMRRLGLELKRGRATIETYRIERLERAAGN